MMDEEEPEVTIGTLEINAITIMMGERLENPKEGITGLIQDLIAMREERAVDETRQDIIGMEGHLTNSAEA
jgi:hypothetical protein